MSEVYEIVSSETILMQGDFIPDCPIFVPINSKEVSKDEINGEVIDYDVIVMSQSCDIENKKLELILVCPIWTLDKFSERQTFYKNDEGKESLRRGLVAGNHILHECNLKSYDGSFLVVDFRSVFSINYNFLIDSIKSAEDRIRLKSPYREHLSQAFARFFMRVGLPTNIPPFSRKPNLDIPE